MRYKKSKSFKKSLADFYKLFTPKSKKDMLGIGFYRNSLRKEMATAWIILGSVILILLLSIVWFLVSYPMSHSSSNSNSHTATLIFTLRYTKRTFQGEVTANMTILDALVASIKAGKIEMLYSVNKNNETRITEVLGHKTASNLQIYIDSKEVEIKDLNKIAVKPGSTIEVRIN